MKFPALKENERYVVIYSNMSCIFISIQVEGSCTSLVQYTSSTSLIEEVKMRMACLKTWYDSMRSFGYNVEAKPFEVRLFQRGKRPDVEHFECIPKERSQQSCIKI